MHINRQSLIKFSTCLCVRVCAAFRLHLSHCTPQTPPTVQLPKSIVNNLTVCLSHQLATLYAILSDFPLFRCFACDETEQSRADKLCQVSATC